MYTLYYHQETDTLEFVSSTPSPPAQKDIFDPEKYELRWAVIQFNPANKVGNKFEFPFEGIYSIHSISPKEKNTTAIKETYKKRVKKNQNNPNVRACLAFIAIPKQKYESTNIDDLYKGLSIENIHTANWDEIPIVPLRVMIQGIDNIRTNPHYFPKSRIEAVESIHQQKNEHTATNASIATQTIEEQPLSYYTLNGVALTDESTINDILTNPQSPGYLVDGGWFFGLESIGRRPTQEDTMFAISLVPEDHIMYSDLNDQEKKSLLKDTTKELSNHLKNDDAGSTGIITIIEPNYLKSLTANLGDSQVFVVKVNKDNELIDCKRLNTLHTPMNPKEHQRIVSHFGEQSIINGKRILNKNKIETLSVSRAFGDKNFQQSGLISEPELILNEYILNKNEELFFVVACDGLTEGIPEKVNPRDKKMLKSEYHDCLPAYVVGNCVAKNRTDTFHNLCLTIKNYVAINSRDNVSFQFFKLTPNMQDTTKIMAVFDGHGGDKVSKYLRENWFKTFKKHLDLIYHKRKIIQVSKGQSKTFSNSLSRRDQSPQGQDQRNQSQPKYLLLSHYGVLDGSLWVDGYSDPIDHENDFIINEIDKNTKNILRNGKQIVEMLTQLTQQYNYKILFHFADSAKEQINLLAKLKNCCSDKGIIFPNIDVIAIYDPKNYSHVSSANPVIKDNDKGLSLIYWGAEQQEGKASLRRALEIALKIDINSRKNCTVFDNSPSTIQAAQDEGYQTILVENDANLLIGIQEKLPLAPISSFKKR